MKRMADKIHFMETLITVKGLKCTRDRQPKQWIQMLTEACQEQCLDFNKKLELFKMAFNIKKMDKTEYRLMGQLE